MLRGLARSIFVLSVFWAASTLLKWPIWVALPIGGFVAAVWAFSQWWRNKTRIYTRRALSAKPFKDELPPEVANSIATSPALRGDETYSQKVAGEKSYAHNFKDLMEYAKAKDGDLLEVQCALVAEPANPFSSHAVAVTCGGVVLGYIPEFESEALFAFLMASRGVARVNSNIRFDLAGGFSNVELDLVRPYSILPGV